MGRATGVTFKQWRDAVARDQAFVCRAQGAGLALENARLQSELAAVKRERWRVGAQEYWSWQGDGEDHLESLTCPVVADPSRLKAIVDELARLRKCNTPEDIRELAETFKAAVQVWLKHPAVPYSVRVEPALNNLLSAIAALTRPPQPPTLPGLEELEEMIAYFETKDESARPVFYDRLRALFARCQPIDREKFGAALLKYAQVWGRNFYKRSMCDNEDGNDEEVAARIALYAVANLEVWK